MTSLMSVFYDDRLHAENCSCDFWPHWAKVKEARIWLHQEAIKIVTSALAWHKRYKTGNHVPDLQLPKVD